MSRIFREIFCGHFPWKLKDENLRKISPKFRRIFRRSLRRISQELRSGGSRVSPESRNATNPRILGTGKGKLAANLGSTLTRPCPHFPCRQGALFEIDSSSLLKFCYLKSLMGKSGDVGWKTSQTAKNRQGPKGYLQKGSPRSGRFLEISLRNCCIKCPKLGEI